MKQENCKIDRIFNQDCITGMKQLKNSSVDFTLTDIPYNAVNRESNGLRRLTKYEADILTFDLEEFLNEVYRITKNSIIIFCGKEQFSYIYNFFSSKKGTTRPIIWEKTNPSPMNGKYVYLSGVEMAVWFKKRGAKTFNAFCKNTVFRFPNGKSKLHPTEKNHKLLEELILDNTNENDIVFDPCLGSGAHLFVAKRLNRKFLGFEINEKYYNIAKQRLNL
jgi:DNA modification methylase